MSFEPFSDLRPTDQELARFKKLLKGDRAENLVQRFWPPQV